MKPDVRDRREFQRLKLSEPIAGRFGARTVRILEVGVTGARVEHEGPIKNNSAAPLRFLWGGESIELDAEVVRSVISKSSPSLMGTPEHPAAGSHAIYHSGLQFLNAVADSGQRLRRMLTESVRLLLEARRIQMGDAASAEEDEDEETLRTRNFGFLSYTLEDGVWKKRRMFLPDQPQFGFAVAATEDKEELQRICRAYEQADEEGRRLIRLFAELSVSEAMNIPHRKSET
jgi:hypothetical protein